GAFEIVGLLGLAGRGVGDRRPGAARTGQGLAAIDRDAADQLSGDAVRVVVLAADGEVQLAVEERPAVGALDVATPAVAVGRDARRDVGLEALETLVGDEVDHAGHGVGAVGGRGAAG